METNDKCLGLQSNIRITSSHTSDRRQGAVDAFDPDDIEKMKQYTLCYPDTLIAPSDTLYQVTIDLDQPLKPRLIVEEIGTVQAPQSEPVNEYHVNRSQFTYRAIRTERFQVFNPDVEARTIYREFFKR